MAPGLCMTVEDSQHHCPTLQGQNDEPTKNRLDRLFDIRRTDTQRPTRHGKSRRVYQHRIERFINQIKGLPFDNLTRFLDVGSDFCF
jgi:hypothetical protein